MFASQEIPCVMSLLFLQVNRESVEQWAAMWENIRGQSRKEEDEERKRTEKSVRGASASAGVSIPDVEGEPAKNTEFERTVVTGILKSVVEELNGASADIVKVIEAIENTVEDDKLGNTIDAKLVAKAAMADLDKGKGASDVTSGEWMSIALSKVLQNMEKTKFKSLSALLKIILFKIVPYDLCYPPPTRSQSEKEDAEMRQDEVGSGEISQTAPASGSSAAFPSEPVATSATGFASKLNVGKYKITSVVETRDGRQMRSWYCPYENCNQKFGSSRKCGAHLNEHLNRIYECPHCKYQTYSLDGYDHHICFRGPKTQGERKYNTGRKRKASASASAGGEVKVKKEKTEGADVEDCIILDN